MTTNQKAPRSPERPAKPCGTPGCTKPFNHLGLCDGEAVDVSLDGRRIDLMASARKRGVASNFLESEHGVLHVRRIRILEFLL